MSVETKNQQQLKIIKSVVGQVFKDSIKGLKINDTLVLTVYNTLKQLYIDDVDNVTISAPTGSGKSIISYLLAYCTLKINEELGSRLGIDDENIAIDKAYILTSSIMLQKQIEGDIERFQLDSTEILMGSNNYNCINEDLIKQRSDNEPIHWKDRACAGMSKLKIRQNFKCFESCPYFVQLAHCSTANTSILNYQYFMKAVPNVYFPKGFITICDEAHLLPGIIVENFSVVLTKDDWKFVDDLLMNHLTTQLSDAKMLEFKNLSKIFHNKLYNQDIKKLKHWYISFMKICDDILGICDDYPTETLLMFPILKNKIDKFKKLFSRCRMDLHTINQIQPTNLFVNCESDEDFGFKFNVRDLDEKNIIKGILSKIAHKTVFLSATYGSMDAFHKFFEFQHGNKNYRLPSTFDFSKSPIILKNSGWLNYKNFNNNIDKVIVDTLKVVNSHKNQNGIIHTGTFKIANLLHDYLQKVPPAFRNRFLFYSNTKEKNQIIDKLINANKRGINTGFILVGPSLYEGLDLKDDLGRFNIIIKAPYGALDAYTKEKMKRYPKWYRNSCLQKIEQAIGRTNRHKNDYSTVYLMDNSLKDLVLSLDDNITKRLIYG